METIKMPLTGIADIDELIETQQNRIKLLKSTILILEETINLKDERIEMLNEMLSNKTRSESGSDKRSE